MRCSLSFPFGRSRKSNQASTSVSGQHTFGNQKAVTSCSDLDAICSDENNLPHPPPSNYDYVVIGGGAAGCALAASLANIGKTLLLERGKSMDQVAQTQDQESWPAVLDQAVEWSQTEQGSWAAMGNVLGGGSSINAGVFLMETKEGPFFDEHQLLNWHDVQRAYTDVSERIAYQRQLSDGFANCMSDAMIEAGLGKEAIATSTAHIGISHPYTIFNNEGKRCSAAHLLPHRNDPAFQNLTIRTNVMVTRVLFDTQGPLRAIGIEFHEADQNRSEVSKLVLPRAEFYLCGGALRTPHLLMLSGVGDASELRKHGIKVVLDNPHVGRHLKDQPIIPVSVSSFLPIERTVVDTMAMTEDFHIEIVSGGTIASQLLPVTLAMIPAKDRRPYKRCVLRKLLRRLPRRALEVLNQQFSIILILNNPVSEGSVTLSNADPYASPQIHSPGLEDPAEFRAMANGLVAVKKLLGASPLQRYRRDHDRSSSSCLVRAVGKRYCSTGYNHSNNSLTNAPATFPALPHMDVLREAQNQHIEDRSACPPEAEKKLHAWMSALYTEGWHYTSTCRFGQVVGPDFAVLDIDGLRIVDASVLRRPPRVNTQATIMMLGFYAGREAARRAGRLV
jgi:choline dehydrogenase